MVNGIMDVIYMIFGPPPETLELVYGILRGIADFFANLF